MLGDFKYMLQLSHGNKYYFISSFHYFYFLLFRKGELIKSDRLTRIMRKTAHICRLEAIVHT
jgi:hypothetical protein